MGLFSKKGSIACSVCGVTLKKLRADHAAWIKTKHDPVKSFMMGKLPEYMMKCAVCGAYTCTKCARDDGMYKRCRCGEVLDMESIVK